MNHHAVAGVSIVPTGAALGAEIRGVDLARDVDAATFGRIEDAFNRYGVIFFRRQNITVDQQIAFARVSTSGQEARRDFLTPADGISANPDRLLEDAKQVALGLARAGYRPSRPRTDVPVLGTPALATFKVGIHNARAAGHISEHDALVATKVATILCGGDRRPGTASEQHYLDLEREAFLSLLGTKKTKERVAFIPVLRAGLGMVDAALRMVPEAQVWHLGLSRDEQTLQPSTYYRRLPDSPRFDVAIILDPMLSTGGSGVAAVTALTALGVPRIKFVGIIGAPEGVGALTAAFPAVQVYLAAVDERLNEHGYILPGLGDAGDRQFGTL